MTIGISCPRGLQNDQQVAVCGCNVLRRRKQRQCRDGRTIVVQMYVRKKRLQSVQSHARCLLGYDVAITRSIFWFSGRCTCNNKIILRKRVHDSNGATDLSDRAWVLQCHHLCCSFCEPQQCHNTIPAYCKIVQLIRFLLHFKFF